MVSKIHLSLLQLREQNGILQADKEEYQERSSLLMDEFQHVKREHYNLVKEKKIIQREIVSAQSKLESTANKLTPNDKQQRSSYSVPALEFQSDQNHQLTNSAQEHGLRPIPKGDLEDNESCTVHSNHSKPSMETTDMSCTPSNPPEPLDMASDGPCILCDSDSSPSDSDTDISDIKITREWNESEVEVFDHITSRRRSESLETVTETLHGCNKVKMNPEVVTTDIKYKMSACQAAPQTDPFHQEDVNGEVKLLKGLLDDAMRKIRKFEYFSDKEEQLEKQKQSLLAQIDRNNEIHSTVETKLRCDHKKTKVELKEALGRCRELERETQTLQKSLSEALNTSSSGIFDSVSLGEHSQVSCDDKDMTCVINHLDRLLSK